jgi:hypothetical protein
MRVCETCKFKGESPEELAPLVAEWKRFFPKVFYCRLLQVIRCYDPSSPARMFDCEFHQTEQQG